MQADCLTQCLNPFGQAAFGHALLGQRARRFPAVALACACSPKVALLGGVMFEVCPRRFQRLGREGVSLGLVNASEGRKTALIRTGHEAI